jgi:hypothetical protein
LKSKLICMFICVLFLFSTVSVSSAGTFLGKTQYGWVEKEVYGNAHSSQTVVLIVGVHPIEYGFHNAMLYSLRANSKALSKKFVIYRVHVTKTPMNYNKGRIYGQLLAQKFVVPDVKRQKSIVAVDIHENRWKTSGYKYSRFLYPISKNARTYYFANKVIKFMPYLKIYVPPKGTSPTYVTKPISSSGIPTLIYETYKSDSYSKKYTDATRFIRALDK